MTEEERIGIEKTFAILSKAKTDNERFAALLVFAKVTNAKDLSLDERRLALSTIGITFFSRLLKSKNIPEDCPATVYKSLALKILSGLCGDKQLVLEFEIYKILRSLNEILTDNTSESDVVDNCYDLLVPLSQTGDGSLQLVDYGTITALSDVISKQLHGYDKAQAILQSVIHLNDDYVWKKEAPSMHIILQHFCEKLDTIQDKQKFEICVIVAGIISSLPREIGKKSFQRPWFTSLIHALNDMFTSKLGEPQREPALGLASAVLDKLGVDCVLPPYRDDCKLLLIIIHLSCIEIRITLENLTVEQISSKADTLVSCYNLIELIICHMTSAPSLKLDETQVLQLHSAMEGAFNSVIYYLCEQSEQYNQIDNPDQIVLASVRVLGSWLAEETSALKSKVQEILPFIIKLCKSQIHCQQPSNSDVKKKVVKFKCDDDTENEQGSLSSEFGACNISTENKTEQNKTCHISYNSANMDKSSQEDCGSGCQNDTSASSVSKDSETESSSLSSSNEDSGQRMSEWTNTSHMSNDCVTDFSDQKVSLKTVDLIRFLLPGFCHMTSDDTSRKILLDNNIQSVLSTYFSNCVDILSSGFIGPEILSSLETMCGVFLNLAVLEPKLVKENEDFHTVTKYIFKYTSIIGCCENNLTVWSNMVTLGVFNLRHQTHIKYDKDQLTAFFTEVVRFIKAPYTSSVVNGAAVLTVTKFYQPVWDSMYQLWYLCLQATTVSLPEYPTLVYAMMSTGFLPHIIRLLNKVQGRNVDEDTLLCLIGVITSLTSTESKAKDVLRSCGGLEFSKMYECSELEKLIT